MRTEGKISIDLHVPRDCLKWQDLEIFLKAVLF